MSPTILVVEDDAFQQELYQQELTDEGYDVMVASDGREAIQVLQSRRPDVVILDLHMPGMDGIDVLSRMLDVDHRLPVIIYTAYSAYKESFMTWLADAYLTKQSDLTPLKRQIRELLAERAAPALALGA